MPSVFCLQWVLYCGFINLPCLLISFIADCTVYLYRCNDIYPCATDTCHCLMNSASRWEIFLSADRNTTGNSSIFPIKVRGRSGKVRRVRRDIQLAAFMNSVEIRIIAAVGLISFRWTWYNVVCSRTGAFFVKVLFHRKSLLARWNWTWWN